MKKNFILALIIVLFMGCESKENDIKIEKKTMVQLSAVQKKRVSQDNKFTMQLLRKTIANSDKEKTDNFFLSPMSVSMAFGMVLNGANGETKEEILKAINMKNLTQEELNAYYQLMMTELPKLDKKTKFRLANALWFRKGFPVKKEFTDINQKYFNAYVKSMDFSQKWAVDTINDWTSRNTNKLIPKILDRIDGDAVAFIMNALYFKGTWATQFNKKGTREQNFTNEKGEIKKVNMMHVTDTFAYAQDKHCQYLKMPYGNGNFEMVVALPKKKNTISTVVNDFDMKKLDNILAKMKEEEVVISFPRFRIKQRFKLKKTLWAMGMQKAFAPSADFTRMSNLKPLFISFVQHDTCIEVTEEGTEAAAVTTIGIKGISAMDNTIRFIANRPFLLFIREKGSGAILFVGKISDLEKF